jgi:hypothetical protein
MRMPAGELIAVAHGLESIRDDELRRLHGYWRRKRGPEGWIRARDFRAGHLLSALPYVAVIERSGGPARRLVIRFAGHAIANLRLGFIRERLVGQLRPDWYRDHLHARYDEALDAGVPMYQHVSLRYDGRAFDYTRLMLPMTRDGAACDQIIVGTVPSPELAQYLRRAPDFG